MWSDINRYQQQYWGQTLATMVQGYGVLLDTQFEIGRNVLHATTEAMTPGRTAEGRRKTARSTTAASPELIVDAVERRIRAGFAPPSEAHLVQNRHRIN